MQFVEAVRGINSYIHPRNIDDCQWRSNSSSSLQQFTVIVVHCISFVAIADTYSTTLTLNNKIKRENRRIASFLHSRYHPTDAHNLEESGRSQGMVKCSVIKCFMS